MNDGATFKSKIDAWLVALTVLPVVIVVAMESSIPHIWASPAPWIALGGTAAIGLGLSFWALSSTSYRVGGDALVIRCALLKVVVPLHAITSITRTRSARSAPALSLDRLAITYGQGQQIMISPRDRAGFCAALARAGVAAAQAMPVEHYANR